jgi:hypothetical protein
MKRSGRCLSSLLSIIAIACQQSRSSSSSDSLSVAAVPVDAAGADSVLPTAQSTDSALLEFEGYYVPREPPSLKGESLQWLILYHPRGPGIFLGHRDESDPETIVGAYSACPQAVVTRDTLDLTCPVTPWGVVRIQGAFADTLGRIAERYGEKGISSGDVLTALLRVDSGAGFQTIGRLQFYWFAGD